MDHKLPIYLLFLFLLRRPTLTSAAANSPAILPSAACSDELIRFSACLPFIAVFPNNRTDFPPPQCCSDVSAAFGNGTAVCLCYFALQPKIVEFPINSTKLFSLASVCPLKNQNSEAEISLEILCSGLMGTGEESSGSELPSQILSSKISSATGNMKDNVPLMQQPSSDYPPETNSSATTPSEGDLSTFPDLRKRTPKSPKPPNPPKPPGQTSPPSPPKPPIPPIYVHVPNRAPGPSCNCSQTTNLLPPSHYSLALLSLYSCFF